MEKTVYILLVEDNRMDVELTLDAFREAKLGSKVYVANNGQEALDYVFGHGKYADRGAYPLPDLILLDLKMPGIDGHEVLHKIKNEPGLRRIPVIVLTSSREQADLITSYENGANSYLVKPMSIIDFMDVVRQVDDYLLILNVPPPKGKDE